MDVNYPWPQEAPKPAPVPFYNRLLQRGREGKNEWWRYMLGILLSFFVGYQIIGAIPLLILVVRAVVLKYVTLGEILANSNRILEPEFLHVSRNAHVFALLFIFIGAMFFLWIAVRFIHKKPFIAIISGCSNRFDFSRYFTAFGIWFAMCAVQLFIAYQSNPGSFQLVFQPSSFAIGAVICILILPIQTGWEELFFRGYLLQGLGTWTRKPLFAWLATSILFGLVHIMNTEVQVNGILATLPQYILPGLVFGAIAMMDERLELAMGMHFAHNLFALLTVTSPDMSLQTNSIWSLSGTLGTSDAVLGDVLQVLALGIFFAIYKWDIKKLYKQYA